VFTYSARFITDAGPKETGAFVRVVRNSEGVPVRLLGVHSPVINVTGEERQDFEPVRHDGWVYHVDTGLVLASDSINDLHGLERGVLYPRAQYGTLFDPGDYARGLAVMDDIANGKYETGNYELRMNTPEGVQIILITAHGSRNEDGRIAKVIGYRTAISKPLEGNVAPPPVRVGFWAKDLRSGAFIIPDEDFCKIYRVDRNSPTLDQDIRARYLPGDADAAYDFIEKAVAEGRTRGAHTFALIFEDKSSVHVRLEFFVESDEQGPTRMNGTVLALP
jgi:hypothetical protein